VGEGSAKSGVTVAVGGTVVGEGWAASVCAMAVWLMAFTVACVSTFGAVFVGKEIAWHDPSEKAQSKARTANFFMAGSF
jgi:hypothetical protein